MVGVGIAGIGTAIADDPSAEASSPFSVALKINDSTASLTADQDMANLIVIYQANVNGMPVFGVIPRADLNIENGKITGVVKNPNYRGTTVDFWNKLSMVGNNDTMEVYGTPYCGKGEPSQVIRVGHAAPPCLFGGIEVFGGAS